MRWEHMTRHLSCVAGIALAVSFGVLAQYTGGFEGDPYYPFGIAQVSFRVEGDLYEYSRWGKLTVHQEGMCQLTDLCCGYISVVAADLLEFDVEFLVLDMPFREDADYPELSTYFDLGTTSGVEVDRFPAVIIVTGDPLFRYLADPSGPLALPCDIYALPISQVLWNAWNVVGSSSSSAMSSSGPRPPGASVPSLAIHSADLASPDQVLHYSWYNVQAANAQCFPMALANGLQYLESRFGIDIAEAHTMGLKGDSTLVGTLDQDMSRRVMTFRNEYLRWAGEGVPFAAFLEGMSTYLATHGETDLVHRHQGRGYVPFTLPPGTFPQAGQVSSRDEGDVVTEAWLIEQLDNERAVELVFRWCGASHAVRIFGYGRRRSDGRFMLYFLDDETQPQEPSGYGDADGLRYAWVEAWDMTGNGILNLASADFEICFAASHAPF